MTLQLQSRPSTPICRGVILSRLFAIFIAISLMFGPLVMDQAMAAAPASGHAQMTDREHCPSADDDMADKAMSKPCCAAMCAATAVVPQAVASEPLFIPLPAIPALASFHSGVLSEISTPPPRFA